MSVAPASAFEMPCGSADERPTCLDFAEDLKPTNAALPVLVPQCQRHPPLPPPPNEVQNAHCGGAAVAGARRQAYFRHHGPCAGRGAAQR